MNKKNILSLQISYKEWLEKAKIKCIEKSCKDNELEKDFEGNRFAVPLILLELVTKKSKAMIRAYNESLLEIHEVNLLDSFLDRYLNNEPLAYILGYKEFYGRDFFVSSSTLIPRSETELIIDHVLDYFRQAKQELMFCDIGTGTACLALTLLAELKNAKCLAYDISSEALEIARKNADNLGLKERIQFIEQDVATVTSALDFDCIVSNPPYIPLDEYSVLDKNVKEFEPKIALTSGENGFEIIEEVIKFAGNFLKKDGLLLIEHGYNQAEKVCEIAREQDCFSHVESIKDYSGNWRICKIIK